MQLRPMDIDRVEMARIAVRLIRNDAASVSFITDQARTNVSVGSFLTGALRPTHTSTHINTTCTRGS